MRQRKANRCSRPTAYDEKRVTAFRDQAEQETSPYRIQFCCLRCLHINSDVTGDEPVSKSDETGTRRIPLPLDRSSWICCGSWRWDPSSANAIGVQLLPDRKPPPPTGQRQATITETDGGIAYDSRLWRTIIFGCLPFVTDERETQIHLWPIKIRPPRSSFETVTPTIFVIFNMIICDVVDDAYVRLKLWLRWNICPDEPSRSRGLILQTTRNKAAL